MTKLVALFTAAVLSATLARAQSTGSQIARAAERQVGVTLLYDPAYRPLGFPGGEVPRELGSKTCFSPSSSSATSAGDVPGLRDDGPTAFLDAPPEESVLEHGRVR